MRAKITATFLFMFTVGTALGPVTVSSLTTYLFDDPLGTTEKIRYSLALMHVVLGPLAVFIFWKGLRAYGEAFARSQKAQ
jgi:MFS family permease